MDSGIYAGESEVEDLRRQVHDLEVRLRRSELRLAGARKQIDWLVASADAHAEDPDVARLKQQLEASELRCRSAEARFAALESTKMVRWMRLPRAAYGAARRRVIGRTKRR